MSYHTLQSVYLVLIAYCATNTCPVKNFRLHWTRALGFVMLSWAGIAMTRCTTTQNIPDGILVIQMRQCVFCPSPVARFHLNRTEIFLAEFFAPAEKICPRDILRRVIEKANTMEFSAYVGFEYEFFVFNETRESIRKKHYHDLKTLALGNFGYSIPIVLEV